MLRVSPEAKRRAKQGLKTDAGLTKREAEQLGIMSGRVMARRIIRSKFISLQDAMRMARFYMRFRNCRSIKCENAILLWGGRNWLKNKVLPFVRRVESAK